MTNLGKAVGLFAVGYLAAFGALLLGSLIGIENFFNIAFIAVAGGVAGTAVGIFGEKLVKRL